MAKNGPILIFEDDPDEIEMIELALKNLKVPNQLRFFDDSEQFFDYLRSTEELPFLIISDVTLNNMSGLELRERLQNDDELRKKSIPFVYFSFNASANMVTKAYELTIQGFFEKQNKEDEVEKHLKMIVDYWGICKHPNS